MELISGRSHQPRESLSAHGITQVEAAVRTLAVILPGPGYRPGGGGWGGGLCVWGGRCHGQAGHVNEAADSHPGAGTGRREGEVVTVADWEVWQHLLRDL